MDRIDGTPVEVYYCSECGSAQAAEDVVRFGERRVCAACKDAFTQRLKEGALQAGEERYGGFWIRAGASIVDGLLTSAMLVPVQVLLTSGNFGASSTALTVLLALLSYAFGLGVSATYEVLFLVRYGATPGKMICGLRVVRADGAPLTWQRMLGRYFAKFISWTVCGVGLVLAGFDEQKRALHDHICSTRVMRKAA